MVPTGFSPFLETFGRNNFFLWDGPFLSYRAKKLLKLQISMMFGSL